MTGDRDETAASTEHGEDRDALHVSTSFGIGRSQSRTAPVALERGTVVAGFTVEELIGSGGMGSVYRAMQASPRRTVALKVILGRTYTPLTAARFELEVATLARLRHPLIAHVYDAGIATATSGPIPYIAMELVVDGVSITRFATDRDLDLRQRVALFLQACDAVAHAHERGVIHRDIKPGNILVDRAGQPKLIDFGIAQSLVADPEAGAAAMPPGDCVGTPQYMSPEQFLDDPAEVDTRSDVYSLGMVLHELLSGRLPYDVTGVAGLAAARVAAGGGIDLPKGIDRRLAAVVAKCLAPSRPHRYASAADVATELRRFLADEAVAAAPEGVLETLLRSVRRSRTAGVLTAAGVLLTLGLITGLTVFAIRGSLERTGLLAELKEARASTQTLTDERDRADRARQTMETLLGVLMPPTSADVADSAASLRAAQEKIDPSLSGTARAAALASIGRGFAKIGLAKDAVRLLEQAVALRNDSVNGDPEAERRDRASLLGAHMDAGNVAQARDAWEELLAWHVRHQGPTHDLTTVVMREMATYLARSGRWPDRAIELARQVRDAWLARNDTLINRVNAHRVFITVLGLTGRNQELLEEIARLMPDVEKLAELPSDNFVEHLHDLGDILSEADPAQSIALHARALAESERRHGALHTKTIGSRRRFAMALLADPTALQRHHDLLAEVLAQQRAALGSDARLTLATLGVLGDAARRLGRHEEAISLLREAHERWSAAGGSESPDAVRAALALAEALLDAGMEEPAGPLVASSWTAVELMYGDDHPATRRARDLSERLANVGVRKPAARPSRPGSTQSNADPPSRAPASVAEAAPEDLLP